MKEEKVTEQTQSSKLEVQHQPVQQDSTTKILTDLVKRLEGIEKNIEQMKRNPTTSNIRRGSGRGRGGYIPRQNQPNQNNRNDQKNNLNQ